MFCGQCGRELPEGAVFCPYCAPDLEENEPVTELSPYRFYFNKTFLLVSLMQYDITVRLERDGMDVDMKKTVLAFFKRPEVQRSIPYSQIESIEYGTTWSIPALVTAAILAVLSGVTLQFYGFIIVAISLFAAYGHAVTIKQKNGETLKLYDSSENKRFIDDLQRKLNVKP